MADKIRVRGRFAQGFAKKMTQFHKKCLKN